MLHYYGDITAMDLAEKAKRLIWMYEKPGEEVCLVPFMDLERKRKRFVKFERMLDQWVFVDLVD